MSTGSTQGRPPRSGPRLRSVSRRLRSRQPKGLLDRPRRGLGGKSIWDWLDLASKLAIPLAVALAAGLFGLWQSHLTDLQNQNDQRAALDQQRATILQTYIDNMQSLLLNHQLSGSAPGAEVAREQTITTLRRLDAGRNEIVLQFLQETSLIQDGVVNLSYADLSNDQLSGARLSDATLDGVDLSGADLTDADLSGTTLDGADLSGADLSGADLSNAQLSRATLTGANLTGARLGMANLTSAFLGDAIMSRADMAGADLNGATLQAPDGAGAQLNGADLSDATLDGANLSNADLGGADLSDADLSGSNLTQAQLDGVYSCANAIQPQGLKCQHSPKITLTYWYTESTAEVPVIRQLIRQFERKNPNITIQATNTSYGQTQSAFITAAQAGKAPDVLRSDVGWVTQFASQGYLLKIDPYVTQSDLSDYLNAPLGSAPLDYDEYNGNLYGLPQVTDFLALLYNKEELGLAGVSPPATMAEFETDAMEIVQRKAATYGFEANGSSSYYTLPFLYAFGGGMFDEYGNIVVNDSGSVAGLSFLLKLQNTDKVMPQSPVEYGPRTSEASTMLSDFMNGTTAMIFDGPFDVKEILTGSSFKKDHDNLGIASIPTGPAGQTGSPLGGQSYVISADTAHPYEAYKFISFMSSTASQVMIAKANDTLPTRESAYQDGASSVPVISEFLSFKNIAVPRPVIPQDGNLFDAFDPAIGAALDGAESPVTALNAVAEAWKQLLAGS